VRGKRAAFVRPADQQPDSTFRHARFTITVDEEGTARRSLLRRFEHDCIARDQRGNDVPVGQMRGEVERAEHCQDAVRLVADGDLAGKRGLMLLLRGPVGVGWGRNPHLVGVGAALGSGQRLLGGRAQESAA
jgi:hypothetical protein